MNAVVRWAQVLFVLLAVFVGVVIFFADTGTPNRLFDTLRGIRYGDKIGHFVLYGLLAFLLHLSLRGAHWRLGRIPLPVAAVVVLGFGLLEEFSQLYSPLRTFDLVDVACNVAGVAVFLVPAYLLLRRLEKTQPSSSAQRS